MKRELRPFDRLIDDSYQQNELHPTIKRMILRAATSALHQVTPDSYHQKCHGAALSVFMILRTLRIRSIICGGTVSWLFGGIDQTGTTWQTQCGFWAPNPDLPTPHAWVLTEFDGLVDVTCAYFHHTLAQSLLDGTKAHDVIPMIWTKTEHLRSLPALRYEVSAKFRKVDLERCDELARQMVGRALINFWTTQMVENLLEPGTNGEEQLGNLTAPELDIPILDGLQTIEALRQQNSWVARNSKLPTSEGLITPPR